MRESCDDPETAGQDEQEPPFRRHGNDSEGEADADAVDHGRLLQPHGAAGQQPRQEGHPEGRRCRAGCYALPLANHQQHRAKDAKADRVVVKGGADLGEIAAARHADQRYRRRRPDLHQRAVDPQHGMGQGEQQDEVERLNQGQHAVGHGGRHRVAEQEERYIQHRVIEARRLCRDDIEEEASVQEAIGIVPVIVPQIPVGILTHRQIEQDQPKRNRDRQCYGGESGRTGGGAAGLPDRNRERQGMARIGRLSPVGRCMLLSPDQGLFKAALCPGTSGQLRSIARQPMSRRQKPSGQWMRSTAS